MDSIFGLAGRRAGALFFARHLDYFIMTRKFASIYRDLVPFRQIIVTQNLLSTYQDWQKTRHLNTDANSLNRRAVSTNCTQNQWIGHLIKFIIKSSILKSIWTKLLLAYYLLDSYQNIT